jgi:sarcosine oxidase subunit alpha
MDRMISRKKDCIGQTAASRPGLIESTREQLVGLKTVEPSERLTGGGHLFEDGADAIRINDQGYVTSVCWSPSLNNHIGLGFLSNGRARHGEIVKKVDHVRGVTTRCTVCDPVMFDAEGGRLRG